MNMPNVFNDIQYGDELKEFINQSDDVKLESALKLKILNFKDTDLLLVTKKIASPTEVLEVTLFDDASVKGAFSSFKDKPSV